MSQEAPNHRGIVGLVVVLAVSLAAAGVWNFALGKGIPLVGQWDPTVGPVGPTTSETDEGLVTLEQAYALWEEEITQFVDARTPDNYAEGHIERAVNVPAVFDEQEEFLPLFEEFQELNQPDYGIPIVLYCSGADCEDSHRLREKLLERGYYPVDIFFQGYPAWKDAGYPIEVDEAGFEEAAEPLYPASRFRFAALGWAILMVLFLVAAVASTMPRKLWTSPWIGVLFRLVLGGVFIYASIHKIGDPGAFAKQIYGYSMMPAGTVNALAMYLPWLEVTAGGLLIAGAFTRGSALAIGGMLLVFCLAVGYNVARGHSFDCGCFKAAEEEEHVSDPLEVLFRDIAMLVMALQIATLRPRHPGVASLVAKD